ncbi:hypothetical protein EHQ12_09725 [Leptospira gomenensis]|uniref:Uncharacterized protein n=1 Tax=Leptospira gomenensis TaxID=2484974 RepID=A0A5F1YXH3_9LEPT|nr:hypothetical protein EHQ17_01790 [Leptospira gomenensis]TGK39322.1 hypothetical protein EHQ12_09725 [Leptospira gomenensis]TGK52216.1 hypothetical protein EHQ07_01210 [Leptospira gomenensis]TGK62931.1 hypothetical protein EHQ13_07775 [Leptospira gomenensis]
MRSDVQLIDSGETFIVDGKFGGRGRFFFRKKFYLLDGVHGNFLIRIGDVQHVLIDRHERALCERTVVGNFCVSMKSGRTAVRLDEKSENKK